MIREIARRSTIPVAEYDAAGSKNAPNASFWTRLEGTLKLASDEKKLSTCCNRGSIEMNTTWAFIIAFMAGVAYMADGWAQRRFIPALVVCVTNIVRDRTLNLLTNFASE